MKSLEEAVPILRGSERILILCHQFPDGDTLGAASALCRVFQHAGRRAAIRCSDPIGPKYRFLFEGLENEDFQPDLVVTVDVADKTLLGEPLLSQFGGRTGLSIDHHRSGTPFAAQNYTDPSAAATCEIIYDLLHLLGAKIDQPTADALYTGITTDTGCFKYTNTTPRTHRIAADLMEAGADSTEIDRAMFDTKSRARLSMERRVLESIRYAAGGKIALIRITKKMIAESGAVEDDLDGIATIPRCIEGVQIGITLREKDDGNYKVSMRARPPADASKICGQFGGGGHRGAAGCTLSLPMEEAEKQLLAAAERYLGVQQ